MKRIYNRYFNWENLFISVITGMLIFMGLQGTLGKNMLILLTGVLVIFFNWVYFWIGRFVISDQGLIVGSKLYPIGKVLSMTIVFTDYTDSFFTYKAGQVTTLSIKYKEGSVEIGEKALVLDNYNNLKQLKQDIEKWCASNKIDFKNKIGQNPLT